MKKNINVVFIDLDNKSIPLELDSSSSPKTFQAIIDHLPVKVRINRWGDELYTDPTEIDIKEEENAKTEVSELDIAYWPEGKALCLFFGPTPISTNGKILAYSPVNVVGKILDASIKEDVLGLVESKTDVIIR
ncbi:MAG TPA: cyclophilin-like fold protein [Candidatus Nitrosocosmicus sp.]|nr:cyclophilin-like fold protein [Candidatus Nitrosocosmicus sp.]